MRCSHGKGPHWAGQRHINGIFGQLWVVSGEYILEGVPGILQVWLRYHVGLFIRPCMTGMSSIITLFGVKLVVMQYTAELHNNCTHNNLVLTCSNKITAADVNKWTTRTFRCAAPEYSCTLPHVPLWRMNLGCSTMRRPLDHHSTDFYRCCAQCHVLNYTKL